MGARQVGKTWLMEEFAKRAYPSDTVAVNFMEDDSLRESFERANLDPAVLVGLLQARSGKRIIPGKTLLFTIGVSATRGEIGVGGSPTD